MPHAPGKTVKVSVPCSTSNIGPGFDCLGLAFDLRNEFTFTIGETGSGRTMVFDGPEKGKLRAGGRSPFFTHWMDRLFQQVGERIDDISVQAMVHVPNARGLGSSSTAVAGALVGANALLDSPLTQDQLLDLASEIEGHPDNASPALLGGLTASVIGPENKVMYTRWMPSPEFCFVALSPDYEVSTNDARSVLPKSLSLTDAVANSSRMPLLIDALINGHGDRLDFLTRDRMHEPYRESLFRHLSVLRRCARDAGAWSVTVSGAGPTILAIGKKGDGDNLTAAWNECLKTVHLGGTIRVLDIAEKGACVVD